MLIPKFVTNMALCLVAKITQENDENSSLDMRQWDLDGCSNRHLYRNARGSAAHKRPRRQHLSVLIGGTGKLIQMHMPEQAEQLAEAVETEIQREADLWRGDLSAVERGKMAMILAHNGGDIDQGLSGWKAHPQLDQWRTRWGRLVKDTEDDQRYHGAYREAVQVYRAGLSAEAHRHYPLRSMTPLRRARDLCLPFPPFLDAWGTTIIQHPALQPDEKLELCEQLVEACDRVPGQRAYQRALRGILDGADDRDRLLSQLPPL